jgi:hypothetical protein
MKRFYGSAVFEEEEVADSAYTQLQNIRTEEQRRIEYYEREFKMQIDELEFWRAEELASIDTNAVNQIDAQNRLIAQYHREMAQITANAYYQIAGVRAQSLLKFHIQQTSEERAAVASIEAAASSQIMNLENTIAQCHRKIAQIQFDRLRLIAGVHYDFAIEHNIRLTRKQKDIAWARSDATAKIAAVVARRYYVPVFMMRCAKGPCEFCRAKYGTTGTRDELEKLACIPPFHDDCRCWLEEVGYVVMSH